MRKKILVISSYTDSLINFRIDLLKELTKQGYEVYALGPEYSEQVFDELQQSSITFKQYYLSRNGFNPLKDFCTILSLRKLYKEIKPDYILPYTVKPVIYANIAKYGFGIRSLNWITGLGFYGLNSKNVKEHFSKSIMTFLYKISFNKKDIIVFQNTDDVDFFKKKGILKNIRYRITPGSGVNLNLFPFSVPDVNKIKFVFVGRLIEPKGIRVFIEAAKILKKEYLDIQFVVVGGLDENSPTAIKNKEIQLLMEKGIITYVGSVNNVEKYVSESSVFVLPSVYREGVPRSILEALSIGRAIITTDNVGCRETVIKDFNGVLIKKHSVEDLVEAMKLFCNDKELALTYGRNSRKLAEDKFDVRIVNKIMLDALKELD